MKKLIVILLMLASFVSFAQDTTWNKLADGKLIIECRIEKDLFCIRVDDVLLEVPKDKKLMISTDDGYVNLEQKTIVRNDHYTIVKYTIIEKNKLTKFYISDIIFNVKGKTFYMKVDTLTSDKINKSIK